MILNVGAGRETFGDIRVDAFTYAKTITIVADAHFLPFRDEVFDEVHSHNLFEHLKNPFIALQEQKRVLKVSGRLVLLTDNASYWRWHVKIWKFYDISHIGYPYGSKNKLYDRHYAIFFKEHIMNFLTELHLKVQKIEYVPYELGARKIDRILTYFDFCKHMAYPRIKVTGVKI